LTFDKLGRTNSTVLKIDTLEKVFGHSAGGGMWRKTPQRLYWDEEAQKRFGSLPTGLQYTNPKEKTIRPPGMEGAWWFPKERILLRQTVELVPGEPVEVGNNDFKRLVDTCLVRYKIENMDDRPHRVGMRFLLDTWIGGSDRPLFTIPGYANLVDR